MEVLPVTIIILVFNLDFCSTGGRLEDYRQDTLRTHCIDRTGRQVSLGEDYHPDNDSPCVLCRCTETPLIASCTSIGCQKLACLEFEFDPDSCCGYTCTENETVGALDVRQVGKDSALVQWSMDENNSNVTFDHMKIQYNEDIIDKKPWVNHAVGKGANSTLVSGLKPGFQYTFHALGLIGDAAYPSSEMIFKAAQITLDARIGNSLKLERSEHSKLIQIYKNTGPGQFKWPQVSFLNLNAFEHISVERKVTKKGNVKFLLRLHKINPGFEDNAAHMAKRLKGDLVLQFSDIKLFNWAMAHL